MQESSTRPRRQARGMGSVFQLRTGPMQGMWRGSVFVTDERGRKVRKYVSGPTSDAVVAKLKTAQGDADAAASAARTPSLTWWATRWLDSVRLRVRPPTMKAYRRAITGHVLPALGDRLLSDLRPADVEAFLARMVNRGMAPSTVALTRRVLVVCLSDAERDGYAPRNAARLARSPKVDPTDRQRLTAAEVRNLLAVAAQDPRTDALVALALGTGARIGELCALGWADYNARAGTVSIHGTLSTRGVVGPTKSRRGVRTVALPGFAVAALAREMERRPSDSGPILSDAPGRRLTPMRARERWHELRKRAGLPATMRFHDLRGTAATLALGAGVAPSEVARSLGHDPAVLMRTYAGAIPGGREAVAAGIDRALS